jgi:hypothetical protein
MEFCFWQNSRSKSAKRIYDRACWTIPKKNTATVLRPLRSLLMRAGERAYITGQQDAHFGGRYTVTDEFLDVYVKARDPGAADRRSAFAVS